MWCHFFVFDSIWVYDMNMTHAKLRRWITQPRFVSSITLFKSRAMANMKMYIIGHWAHWAFGMILPFFYHSRFFFISLDLLGGQIGQNGWWINVFYQLKHAIRRCSKRKTEKRLYRNNLIELSYWVWAVS